MRNILFALALFAPGVLLAQIPASSYTQSFLNGRYWTGLNESSRMYYILGFEEGMYTDPPGSGIMLAVGGCLPRMPQKR
jgi:hypothetical protein